MSPELATGLGLFALQTVATVMTWFINRNVKTVDGRMIAIETDMRQLAARVGTHGESLASGSTRFAAIEDRVKSTESRIRDLERDCAACQRRGIA